MPYSIVFAQLPIVGGTAGHNYVALLDDAGNVVKEMDGLATNSNGQPIPIGTNSTDTLKVYEFNGAYFYNSSASQATMFSGTAADAQALWARAQDAMAAINALNLAYPTYGFNIFSPTVNSNSVASTLAKAMGLDEPTVSGRVQPGKGNVILTPEQLAAIQAAHLLPAPGGGGGGNNEAPLTPPPPPPPPIVIPPPPPPTGTVTVGDPVPVPPPPPSDPDPGNNDPGNGDDPGGDDPGGGGGGVEYGDSRATVSLLLQSPDHAVPRSHGSLYSDASVSSLIQAMAGMNTSSASAPLTSAPRPQELNPPLFGSKAA